MSTIINNPPSEMHDDGSTSLISGALIIIAILGLLYFFYGMPSFMRNDQPAVQKIEVQLPAVTPVTTQ